MSTTIMDPEEHVELNSRQEALESRVLLLCPTISWWKGMYQLPGRSTETLSEGRTVDKDDVTTPQAKLMTDTYPVDRHGQSWKKRFQKIASNLNAIKEKYSLPFPITGVRIVPKSRGQALLDEIYGLTIGRLRKRIAKARNDGYDGAANVLERQLAYALTLEGEYAPPNTPIYEPDKGDDSQSVAYMLHRAATEFCNDWGDIREQIRRHNAVFDRVSSKVPLSSSAIRAKFVLDVVPVELAGGIRGAHEVDDADLAEHQDIVRDACRRRVEEAIETMIEGPRQQLAEALTDLKDLINRDGRITDRSFGPVRAAISKIRMFDFVANSTLLDQMNQLEQRLNITSPKALDSVTAASNGFTGAIDAFMAEVQDAEVNSRDLEEFGRDFRSIDID